MIAILGTRTHLDDTLCKVGQWLVEKLTFEPQGSQNRTDTEQNRNTERFVFRSWENSPSRRQSPLPATLGTRRSIMLFTNTLSSKVEGKTHNTGKVHILSGAWSEVPKYWQGPHLIERIGVRPMILARSTSHQGD